MAALGRGLFDWLFVPALRDLYEGVRGRLAAGDRLRLLLRTETPDLAAMTRPRQYTGAMPLASLIADVQTFERNYHVAEDNAAVTANLLALLSTVTVVGRPFSSTPNFSSKACRNSSLSSSSSNFVKQGPYES